MLCWGKSIVTGSREKKKNLGRKNWGVGFKEKGERMGEKIEGNLVIFCVPTRKNPLFPKERVGSPVKVGSLEKNGVPVWKLPK